MYELSDPDSGLTLNRGALGLNGDDSGQGLKGVDPTLNGNAEGRARLHDVYCIWDHGKLKKLKGIGKKKL